MEWLIRCVLVTVIVCAPLVGGSQGLSALPLPFESTAIVKTDALGADFAAKELNEIVKLATGREYKVERWKGGEVEKFGTTPPLHHSTTPPLHHSTTPPPHHSTTPPSHRIFLGIDPSLASEESAVYAKGNDLYLMGGDTPGMLWAVYDFVEDNLGYHWYDRRPESQVVEKCDTVVFKGTPTKRRPVFRGFRKDHEGHSSKMLFYLRNRENAAVEHFVKGYRFPWSHRTGGHGWDILLPRHDKVAYNAPTNLPRNLFAAHPEWFSLDRNGKRTDKMQICASNPEMRDALYASLKSWIATYGEGIYMLGVNDDHTTCPLCYCEKCRALDRKYDSGAGAMWEMIADICGRLKRDGCEGVYVTSLAYRRQCEKAPKGLVFPDNFILDLAIGTHTHTIREWGEEPRREAADIGRPGEMYNFYENAKAWGAITKHMSYWLYCDPFLSTSQRLQKEIRELRDVGCESVGSCGGDGCGGKWAFSGFNTYCYLRLLVNPDLDLDALADKAFAALYGPGAPAVKSFWLELEKIRVRSLPLGRRLDGYSYFTGEDLVRIGKTMDAGYEKVKWTKYREAYEYVGMFADMLRIAFPERLALADPNYAYDAEAARERATAASERYFERYVVAGHREAGNPIVDVMDAMAYVPLLKTKELPPELKGVDPKKVTRILPPKRKKNPFWRTPAFTADEDPLAVTGWTIAGDVREDVDFTREQLEFQVYEWATGHYHLTHSHVPKDWLASDRYRLFRIGTCHLGMTSCLQVGRWGKTFFDIPGIRRCADPIFLDKNFDLWISLRAEGPKFFPGDTRKNRVFVDQVFVVEK